MGVEKPTTGESAEKPKTEITGEYQRLRKILGQPPELDARGLDNKGIDAELLKLQQDHYFDSISELYRQNELNGRNAAIQREGQVKKGEKPDTAEMVVVEQGVTYFEYLPTALRQIEQLTSRYDALRPGIKTLPIGIAQREQEMRLFLTDLNTALELRLAFSNAGLISRQLASQTNRKGEVQPDQSALVKLYDDVIKRLDPTSKIALTGSREDRSVRANALDQVIIDLLVQKGHLPGTLVMDLLTARYKEVLDLEKAAVSKADEAKYELLKKKNDLASQGKGVALDAEEAKEFTRLQKALAEGQGRAAKLRTQRAEIGSEIVGMTQDMGDFQIMSSELTTTQHQFLEPYDLEGARTPTKEQTPQIVRDAIARTMEQRSNFHLERIDSYVSRMDEEVLQSGWAEFGEDLANKNGREILRRFSNGMSSLYTLLIPEAGGIRDKAREFLAGPLNEAMGWPADKMDLTFAELQQVDPTAAQRVTENAKSIRDAVKAFDKTKIVRMRETMGMIRSLPPASDFAGQEVKEGVTVEGHIDPARLKQLIAEHGAPTAYKLLFEQLDREWGSTGDSRDDGFMDELSIFVGAVNKNIDTHIDVSSALFQQADNWKDYILYTLYAAAGLAGLYVAGKYGRPVFRAAFNTARFGGRLTVEGTKAAGRTINATRRGLQALSRTQTAEQLTKLRYLERERRLAQWLQKTPAGQAVAKKLAAFRGAKVVRGAGKAIKYVSWAAVPAMTAYDYYTAGQRAEGAKGNKELQGEYQSQQNTALLEGAGGAAALLAPGLLPAVVLGAPVIYAAEFSRSRSEVLADWKRDSADYAREYDRGGLRAKIRTTTDANAVESGGGGTLPSRITIPSKKDLDEAFTAITNANTVARQNAYEAYFLQNLVLEQGASQQEAQKVVMRKMNYLRAATHGGFDPAPLNSVLQRADTYADLMRRKDAMEKAGEEPVIRYQTREGEDAVLDLRQLEPGANGDIQAILGAYINEVQPAEEATLFITLAETAKEKVLASEREEGLDEAQKSIRFMMLQKLSHHILEAEGYVETIDWPGFDFIVSDNTSSQQIVRAYLAHRVNNELDILVPLLMNGEVDPQDYNDRIAGIAAILMDIKNVTDSTSTEFRNKADAYLKEKLIPLSADKLDAMIH